MAVAYQKLSHSITDDAALEQNHITGAGRFERQVFRRAAAEPPGLVGPVSVLGRGGKSVVSARRA